MKTLNILVPIFLISLLMNACYYTESADLLIHNAKIYTVDDNFTIYEAIAVKDGKIIDVGPNNELKNRYEAKEIIDAQLRPIYPGFIDAHCHFLWYGSSFLEVELVDTKGWQEVLDRTVQFAESNSDLWIKGHGWDQNDWAVKEFPTKQELDKLFPDNAVLLTRIDMHAAIANQKALDLAGITESTEVDGGVFEKEDGRLNGLLIDNAIGVLSEAIPPITKENMEKALLKAQEMCFQKGLTTLDDAMLENDVVHVIDDLQKSGKLKMNVYGMLAPTDENKAEFLEKGPYLTDKLSIRSFKYFMDGALGSRGAKLLEQYADDHGNKGHYLLDSAYLLKEAQALYKHGFQMNTHCIGDAANRSVLNIYGSVLKTTNDKRWRIEHAQVMHEEDFEKFRLYTIIPSVQPTHATSDMPWVGERLGEERLKNAYAYQKLLALNGLLALGTDFPIENIDPLRTFYAAACRKDINGEPQEGFQTENKISREDALRGMTIWAAISNFEENKSGSLEKGKNADFIILNQDIINIPENEILKTTVEATYVGGEKVFEN